MSSGRLASDLVKFQSTPPLDHEAVVDDNIKAQIAKVVEQWSTPDGQLVAGDPVLLTRKQKQRRKGLPAPEDLRKLARVWLTTSHELWPELVHDGTLPPISDASISILCDDFTRRFVDAAADRFVHRTGIGQLLLLAAGYFRYSCDNSNPRSLDDQLKKALVRARADKHFMPWEYVFADASVTGRTYLRRGYALLKSALEQFKGDKLSTMYFDDFGRATRDAIESYRLAKLLDRLRMGLIGVSDGFDLRSEASRLHLAAVAMFNDMFISQLQKKVMRGMKGAAERGTSVGKVIFGYVLVDLRDKHGELVMNVGKDRPFRSPKIDPKAMKWVMRSARWFAEGYKSYHWIARHLNAAKAGGHRRWTNGHVAKLLACPLFWGLSIYNRTRTVYDPDTGEFNVEPNPWQEWVVTRVPHLAVWSKEFKQKVRNRARKVRAAAPNTGKKRRSYYATSLLCETLFCGSCGTALNLMRSTDKYKQYGCPRGCEHSDDCTMHSSKSTKICENAVLRWVDKEVLTPDTIKTMVILANNRLAEDADRPKVPTKPLRETINGLLKDEKKVMQVVLKYQDTQDVTAYLKKGAEIRKSIASAQDQLRRAEAVNAEPPPPLDADQLIAHLGDLRGLLSGSVEKSAVLLRALTGKIIVTEHAQPPKKRKLWMGTIKGDLVAFLAAAGRDTDYPFSGTLEYLSGRGWIMPVNAMISLENVPKYEELAKSEAFVKAVASGKIPYVLSNTSGLSYKLAADATRFLKTGVRPKWSPQKPKNKCLASGISSTP